MTSRTQYRRGTRNRGEIHFHKATKARPTLNRETVCGRLTCVSVTLRQLVTCKKCLAAIAAAK